jgi:GH18 family chitinase
MKTPRLLLICFAICLLLSACAPTQAGLPLAPTATQPSTPSPMPIPTATPAPTTLPRPFRVIGYATEAIIVEVIPFDKLTHINYAFLLPNADGSLAPLTNSWKITGLVNRAHQTGVQVLISVGGWGLDPQFEELAANPSTRARFIKATMEIVDQYGFDGVDIDWEYPDPGQSAQNYLALMRELRAALTNKLLTTAVIAYGDEYGQGVPPECFELLDFVNVMTYDGPDHASLGQFQQGLDYWLARGVPPSKLVMGVPFYSRPGEVPFRKLADGKPDNAILDTLVYNGRDEHFNGLKLVEQKTEIALEKASGIMFWTLEQDAMGDLSLLNRIYQTSAKTRP